ncbi:MAG TPA: helix-turn-helix domain-containing protein [Chitinophagaceae bacterium]|nr:helix-turn-helix domain-containing protein [Chitinophagaceae bacterium]
MKVTNPIPATRIADYVDRILIIENFNVTTAFSLPLFANGTPTLLFLTTKATIKNSRTNYLTLFGQTVFPDTLTITDDFTLIAYFFKPFTLYALFGVSAKELTDYPIDLNLLNQKTANDLKERLLNAGTTNRMLELLDNYIFSLITKSKSESQVIKFATAIISKNPSKESLVAVQNELCITERTFERLFDKNIGISPNLFRRIYQFNAAFQQLNNKRFDKLTDVAFENGYADQSHFIRAFKEFTHITPKEYLKFGEPG